ncbi:hypothetical protein FRD01_16170 [Microvenator marinus]|uniref:Uncharacterized protein n=1 Tax=Microvenator marinus TaxID=2600177 RepID=A0A5B8XT60_9DELT|nr:hypothetical protein [Microvenator marinus]QED28744.1 hypothetical protein FRD01_16170 [Microvenator marinus]
MNPFSDIKAYMNRPWGQLRDLKVEFWRDQSAQARMNAGFELHLHVKSMNPDWLGPESREADLQHHIRMSKLFRSLDERIDWDSKTVIPNLQ